jgi:hypothetical protein
MNGKGYVTGNGSFFMVLFWELPGWTKENLNKSKILINRL